MCGNELIVSKSGPSRRASPSEKSWRTNNLGTSGTSYGIESTKEDGINYQGR